MSLKANDISAIRQRMISLELSNIGEDDDSSALIHRLLKVFVEVESRDNVMLKLNIASFLELEALNILNSIADVELVFSTFKNVYEQLRGEDSLLVKGQCLVSMTTILITMIRKINSAELSDLFCGHIKFLLESIQRDDGRISPYIRYIVANCLTEVELCFPSILEKCLENIYVATVSETSIAHQQLMCLLVLILRNILVKDHDLSELAADAESLKSCIVFTSKETVHSSVTLSDLSQILSFVVDQLHLCTEEGSFWICVHLLEIIRSQSDVFSSAQILRPLMLNKINVFSIQSLQLVFLMDKYLGNMLFEVEDQKRLLNTAITAACHNGIPEYQRILYLTWFSEYLTLRPEKLLDVEDFKILLPTCFDEPKVLSKKLVTLSHLLRNKPGSTTVLLSALTSLQKEIKSNGSVESKCAYSVVLYNYLLDHLDSDIGVRIPDLVLGATIQDVSFIPFAVNLARCVRQHLPGCNIPNIIMKTLVNSFTQPTSGATLHNFHHVLDMFLVCVKEYREISQPKVILSYLSKYAMCEEVCSELNWDLGHDILSFCHYVMKEYEVSPYFQELCDIFKSFISYSQDVDIQDRAHMFQSLLLCLSEKKLKELLNVTKESMKDMSINSGVGSKCTILVWDKPVLKLAKTPSPVFTDNNEDSDLQCVLDEDISEQYMEFMSSESFPRNLKLQFCLTFCDSAEESIQVLQALCLYIHTPDGWGKVNPVMIGHFNRNKSTNQLLEMKCFPLKSYPVTLHFSAEFSLQNQCYRCNLEPCKLDISDFFCPLPIPKSYSPTWRCKLFSYLWNSLEEKSQGVNGSACLSVHVAQCSKDLIQSAFHHFVVQEEQDDGTMHVGIFLPPENHLLLKVFFKEQNTVIRIAVDDALILAHLNDYFIKLLKDR